MVMQEKPIPVALLERINRDANKIAAMGGIKRSLWQNLDEFIPVARAEVDLAWPDSVFMPFGLWPCFLERHFGAPVGSMDLSDPMMRGMAQVLSCIAPWRATQDIVRFDPEMEAELKGMDLAGKLPSDILMRLPAWSVYIDAKVRMDGDDYDGFFAQLDTHKAGPYLALTFQGPDSIQQRVPLGLGNFTLEQSLSEVLRHSVGESENVRADDRGLIQALNMVIYLCSYGLLDRQEYGTRDIAYPKAKRIKKRWRIMPPTKARVHVLGRDFGDKLRRDRQGTRGHGGTVRPHVRRPHWHHFWTGSAEKKLIVRWLPPIFVGQVEDEMYA